MREDVLDPQLCLKELPTKLKTWIQPSISAKEDTPDTTWIRINRKSGKASPPERSILAFWSHDAEFDEFLRLFHRRVQKIIATGITTAVNPDISIYWDDDKRTAFKLFWAQLRYGRTMQSMGMTILPNLPLLHPSYAEELYRDLLPQGVPLAAQVQTALKVRCDTRDRKGLAATIVCLETAVRVASPPQVLLYGSRRVFNAISDAFSHPEVLKFVGNFSDALNGNS